MTIWRTKLRGSEFKLPRFNDALPSGHALDNPERLVDYLRPRLAERLIYRPDVENFIVVYLNTRRNAIGFEIISTGTLDTLLVHAREVFKAAIVTNASAIAIMHNHPSGEPSPCCQTRIEHGLDLPLQRDRLRSRSNGLKRKILMSPHAPEAGVAVSKVGVNDETVGAPSPVGIVHPRAAAQHNGVIRV